MNFIDQKQFKVGTYNPSIKDIYVFELAKTFLWFTVLPTSFITTKFKKSEHFTYGINIYQYYFLPVVGLIKGLIALSVLFLTSLIWPLPFASIVSALAYLILSGGIHLDGLTDTTDALFAYGKDKWEVIKDPAIGAMGTIYLVLYLATYLPVLSFAMYLTHQNPYLIPLLLLFSILPKANCLYLLSLPTIIVRTDKHLSLAPIYPKWIGKDTTPKTLHYTTSATLASVLLFLAYNDFYVGAFLLTLPAIANLFNNKLIPSIQDNFGGWIAGDVFGWSVCFFELAILASFITIFH